MHAIRSPDFTIVPVYVTANSKGGAVFKAMYDVFARGALNLSIPNTLATSLRFISYLCLVIAVKTSFNMIPASVLIDPYSTYEPVDRTFFVRTSI